MRAMPRGIALHQKHSSNRVIKTSCKNL